MTCYETADSEQAMNLAPAKATTLRVPVALRDEIARLARGRGTTMVDVVAQAVHRLANDQWWADVREALDSMGPAGVAPLRAETVGLDGASADGLRGLRDWGTRTREST